MALDWQLKTWWHFFSQKMTGHNNPRKSLEGIIVIVSLYWRDWHRKSMNQYVELGCFSFRDIKSIIEPPNNPNSPQKSFITSNAAPLCYWTSRHLPLEEEPRAQNPQIQIQEKQRAGRQIPSPVPPSYIALARLPVWFGVPVRGGNTSYSSSFGPFVSDGGGRSMKLTIF